MFNDFSTSARPHARTSAADNRRAPLWALLFMLAAAPLWSACDDDGGSGGDPDAGQDVDEDTDTDTDEPDTDEPDTDDLCEDVDCGENGTCEPTSGECVCDSGFVEGDDGCEAEVCSADADCDDGLACNGVETCDTDANTCVPGDEVECGESEVCVEDAVGTDPCVAVCEVPQAPVLSPIDDDEVLSFALQEEADIEIATLSGEDTIEDAVWSTAETLELAALSGETRVVARVVDESCAPIWIFDALYNVQATYAPAAGQEGSTAIADDSALFVAWATGHASVNYGTDVNESFRTPEKAYGEPGGSADIVVLGNGGDITLTFDAPITNGEGADFAVFENSFSDGFLEIAFVEVSSDGENFVRFDSAYLGTDPVSAFGSHSPTLMGGLAGTFRAMFGSPFDLQWLSNKPEVADGRVDLDAITHVRAVDIIGDGATNDSFGRAIYDPTPTVGSGGFDLDAVGVIHQLAD